MGWSTPSEAVSTAACYNLLLSFTNHKSGVYMILAWRRMLVVLVLLGENCEFAP